LAFKFRQNLKEISRYEKAKINSVTGSKKKKIDGKWAAKMILVAFFISVFLSLFSSDVLSKVNVFIAVALLLVFILIGIVFDIVGIAVASADEKTFHSMASRKVFAARQAISLIRSAEKVSNFCNDVVGDIAGIVSGSMISVVAFYIMQSGLSLNEVLVSTILTGLVAAATIGGKAVGKTIAMNNNNTVIYLVAVLTAFFNPLFKEKKEKNKVEKKT